jgi:hypothetical protein
LEKSNTSYIDIIESTPKYSRGYRFCRFCIASEDILVITPSDHIIDEMQLYEAAIQEAIEKQQMDILLLLDCTYKTGNGIWIRAQRR